MVNYNTNYYRRNKQQKFKVHKCKDCSFETTGPKSSLNAHIWAKHTLECDRPFQCPCETCDRGYSAKANLHKHLSKQHSIEIPKDKNIFAYSIQVNVNSPDWSDEKKQRFIVYNTTPVMPKKIPEHLSISIEQMYYDNFMKTITISSYTKSDIIRLQSV